MIRGTRMFAAAAGLALLLCAQSRAAELTDSLKKGTPELKSAGALAFGPEGILFVGDSTSAAIFAIGTGDTKGNAKAPVKVEKLTEKIAAMLGAASADITVNDFKVNPASGNIFLSVARGKGPTAAPVLIKLDRAGKMTQLELKDIPFASVTLPNASEKQRTEAITGLAYAKGQLIIAGLSNEEFASKLRAIAFPFKEADKGTSVEIIHGAHKGNVETRSPVRTFTIYDIAGKSNVMAAYQCTPLVTFPVESLKPGEKVRGTTIAELGNGNRPLDMIVYTKEGKDFLLLANNKRGTMKIKLDGVDKAKPITGAVPPKTGVPYDEIKEMSNVVQLDKLDAERVVVLTTEGDLNTVPLP